MPIFNIAEEDYDQYGSSPDDTRWAYGKIADGVENLVFDSWGHTIGWDPPSAVGQNMVLFLITDSIYIEIKCIPKKLNFDQKLSRKPKHLPNFTKFIKKLNKTPYP